MEVDIVLERLSDKVGKSKRYLKGLFNLAKNDYNNKFADAVTEEQKILLSLVKVGKNYNLNKTDIEKLIDKKDEIEMEEDKIEPQGDADIEPTGTETVTKHDSWEKFFSTLPEPAKSDNKKLPSLIIELGPRYYLKMVEPKQPPTTKEFDGQWGSYNKHVFKVLLVKVSDEDLYDIKYKGGNFKGELAFVDGQEYNLWLTDKACGYFKLFWKDKTDDGLPDDRIFTYKFTKNGKYNVHSFNEPKK